jgi:hypothetical protein
MGTIENQVQTLNDNLLKPMSVHKIKMEVFFKDVTELIRQREKEVE